ncbi:hypothetical protein KPSA3_07242 [Pseudomonas syringae pv. actinidiae]|uniref:Uncharacterized protein n=1 Tax=Pseudomonas syringae pv. actinidiae TaxID=103796 RepID=A0AAN4QF65_PSESF|nr:hypothetical protein KPSA3_07242 [Pseudomonas syringae pv. actinidiae]
MNDRHVCACFGMHGFRTAQLSSSRVKHRAIQHVDQRKPFLRRNENGI